MSEQYPECLNHNGHKEWCLMLEIKDARRKAFLEAAEIVKDWRNSYMVLDSMREQEILDAATETIAKLLREQAEDGDESI